MCETKCHILILPISKMKVNLLKKREKKRERTLREREREKKKRHTTQNNPFLLVDL